MGLPTWPSNHFERRPVDVRVVDITVACHPSPASEVMCGCFPGPLIKLPLIFERTLILSSPTTICFTLRVRCK